MEFLLIKIRPSYRVAGRGGGGGGGALPPCNLGATSELLPSRIVMAITRSEKTRKAGNRHRIPGSQAS